MPRERGYALRMSVRPSSQDAISVSQAAELTGASSKSLRRRIERGTLGSIRQGGRRLIPVSELIRVGLLDESGQAQTAAPAFATAAGAGGTLRSPSTQDAAAAAWAAAAPGPPAAAGAAPRRSVPASSAQARPAPATSPPPAAVGRPAQSPVPASRSQ